MGVVAWIDDVATLGTAPMTGDPGTRRRRQWGHTDQKAPICLKFSGLSNLLHDTSRRLERLEMATTCTARYEATNSEASDHVPDHSSIQSTGQELPSPTLLLIQSSPYTCISAYSRSDLLRRRQGPQPTEGQEMFRQSRLCKLLKIRKQRAIVNENLEDQKIDNCKSYY